MNNQQQQQQAYHYRASTTHPISCTSSSYSRPTPSEMPIRSALIQQQPVSTLDPDPSQQNRRRFQKRKQMKRSKSVDLYQELSAAHPSPSSFNQRSISRECLTHGQGIESPLSSSSSSSSIGDIERVNQAALLRHKSLDSTTFQRRTNPKESQRRALSKPVQYDFDSDDSVCGIPKPRR